MKFKVAIVGAGMAGCALAIALQKNKNIDITLFENNQFTVVDIEQCLQSRPLTLTYANVKWLQQLNIWQELSAYARPVCKLDISQSGYFGKCLLDCTDFDLPAIAYVVPAKLLQQVLQQTVARLATVKFIDEISAIASGNIRYSIADAQHDADFDIIFAADGTNSTVRDFADIKTTSHDFKEVAFSAIVDLQNAECLTTAYERFTSLGVIAVLPRDTNTAGVVWTMPADLAEQANAWSDAEWLDNFNKHMPLEINSLRKTASFPLQAKLAASMHSGNIILVGNSAHTFYPIAAQGFNLALRDVMTLSDLLHDGSLSMRQLARKYSELRQVDCNSVKQLTQWTAAVFALRLPLVAHMRGLALAALGSSRCLQQNLIERGFGKVGQMPSGLFDE